MPSSVVDEASTPKYDVETAVSSPIRKKHVRLSLDERAPVVAGNDIAIANGVISRVLVTPATAKRGEYGATAAASANAEVSRALFPQEGAVVITPLRHAEIPKTVEAKRKLIFGRSVVEVELKDSVRQVYTIIKKLTGSIGGNGSFGPIYGELTMGSMQKMVNLMKEHTGFDSSSRFIDVGSGIGKPNLHVAQDPGVEFSYGIEVEAGRWLLGINCLKGVLDAASGQPMDIPEDEKINHRCMFVHGDITNARSFDPFTHVYMFSIGFPPTLWCELSEMWNRSSSSYLICFHGPKDTISSYEFAVELVVQTSTSMHGSKEGHTGYIYRRTPCTKAQSSSQSPACDPYFAETWEKVLSGFDSLKNHVDSKVDENMQSGTLTRSRRR